jgi:hypothetical protein
MILYYQDTFGYKGDIQSLLQLPYCLFQDLIIRRSKKKKAQEGNTQLGDR